MIADPRPDPAADALRALRDKYRAGLGASLPALEQLAAQIEATPTESVVLEALRREVHRLHGSAGTYGFAEAGQLAGALESRLVTWSTDASAETDDRGRIVGNFIRAFRASVAGAENAGDSPRRVIVMIGVEEAEGARINVEATLRGFAVKVMKAEDLTREGLETLSPRVLVLPASLIARVPRGLGVPVIAIAERRRSRTGRAPPTLDVPLITMDATDSPSALVEVVTDVVARADHGGATLLVVDDDPTVLMVIRAIAEHDGLRVVTLDSAAHVRDVVARESPAMLMMDVRLGDDSGIAVTRALRADPAHRELPIVLFSGHKDASTRERAFNAGADDFFGKPIVPSELRRRLHERLERRRLRRLADGMHPLVDVTLAARTAHDATNAWAQPGEQAILVLRPAPGFDDAAWLAEVRRLSVTLASSSRALGFDEDRALLGVFSEDPGALVKRVEELRMLRPSDAPVWHAGVTATRDSGTAFPRALRAAREALDVARRGVVTGVHRWSIADDAVAPDVVVVEDDIALADMLQYALRTSGYTYRAFADGNLAHEALLAMRTGTRRPVVLLDVDLPGMDGHSLHERLRVERPGAFVVVFVSVHASEGDQVRALHAGAWDYMSKPVNLRVLLAKLPVWLARAAAER